MAKQRVAGVLHCVAAWLPTELEGLDDGGVEVRVVFSEYRHEDRERGDRSLVPLRVCIREITHSEKRNHPKNEVVVWEGGLGPSHTGPEGQT